MVFASFRTEIGHRFAYFGLESFMVFEGTTGVYVFIISIPNDQERKKNMQIRNGF